MTMDDLVRQSLDHCVKCTICETHCPVSAVTPLFPGPKYVGPQAERHRSAAEEPVDASLDWCSGCGICTQVCPHDVKIAEINSQARAVMKARAGVPLRDRLIARPDVLGRLGGPVVPLANLTMRSRLLRRLGEPVLGIHRHAPLPPLAGRTFQRWARRRTPSAATTSEVVFFHGCSINWFEPGLGRMTVAVLEHNGRTVTIPPQGCCGLPLQSNGLFDEARAQMRRIAATFAPYARRGVPIVATSTSCGLMLKREAREILGLHDDPDLALVAENTVDICEYLVGLHERGELRTDFRSLPWKVPYHAPCQQQGHGMGKPALDLFALVPDLTVTEMHHACCGIAGTYGLKREKYDVAMKVGAALFDQVRKLAPETSACDSETCRWQITHGSGVPSVHPVEIFFHAYGLPDNSSPQAAT